MAKLRSCFILKLHSANLGVYTNLLAAWNHLNQVTTPRDKAGFPSYSTFNRRLNEVGKILEISTSLGTFTLEHHQINLKCAI